MKFKLAALVLILSTVAFAQATPATTQLTPTQQQIQFLAAQQQLLADKIQSINQYFENQKQLQDLYSKYQAEQKATPAVKPTPTPAKK